MSTTAPGPVVNVGYCATAQKLMYTSRKRAKKAGRESFPGDHPSAYPCGDHWHWGNLNPAVIAGKRTRDGMSAEVPTYRRTSPHVRAAEAMRSVWNATHPQSTTP